MPEPHPPAGGGIDVVAFADLLREPLAASRALLELLASAECPDPGMIGGYLGPALRELGRACELLEDLHVLRDAEHAVRETDDLAAIDVRDLVETAGLETFRRGEMLPPPVVASGKADDAALIVQGHRRTLDRMLRTALELTAETCMPDASEPVALEVHAAEDADLGPIVQLALGRTDTPTASAGAFTESMNAPAGAASDLDLDPDPDPDLDLDADDDEVDTAAHAFRRLVLETIARAQGGRVVFEPHAAPAAMRIDLPRAPASSGVRPEERAA
jgi:hypothetical protein